MSSLDIILSEEVDTTYIAMSIEAQNQLQKMQQQVAILEQKVRDYKAKINADLAICIRRQLPGLHLSIDESVCKVGYKTKHLSISPDLSRKQWIIESPDHVFKARFLSKTDLELTDKLQGISESIVNYFKDYYQQQNESIHGTGHLLLEQNNSTLGSVAKWRNQKARTYLNSRAVKPR